MRQRLFYALILSLFVCGCTKSVENQTEEQDQHHFCINTSFPVLEMCGGEATKAEIQAKITLQWVDGDQISIVNLSSGKTMLGNLSASVENGSVTFEGDLVGSVKSGDKLAAIYPCQNYTGVINVPDFNFDLSSQTCATKSDLDFAAYSVFTCETAGVVNVNSEFTVPVSFNQISISNIDASTAIDYVELTEVGNSISFHVNKANAALELTPSVGKVRICPAEKMSGTDGTLYAYCALAASPAAERTIVVKALPKIYTASWAHSSMACSKFYTSIAADFSAQQYSDFMVSGPAELEVSHLGGELSFHVTSNNIAWEVTSTPSLTISPDSGNSCENQLVSVTVPVNDNTTSRTYQIKFIAAGQEYPFVVTQGVNPDKEVVEFPDINLRQYMLALFDDDEDGEISKGEAAFVQNVNCSMRNVSDLTGLDKCPNLKYLNFNGNYVYEVILPDLSKLETVVAYGNPIEKIDVSNDTALSAFYLQDVSTNAISGTSFNIGSYSQASTLDIAFPGTDLTTLNITNSSELESIDITKNVQLTSLTVSGNPLMSAIDVSTLTNLTLLDVNACGLTSLDVDTNTKLVNLDCSSNNLSSLLVDTNVDLVTLDCSDNNLSALKVANNINIEELYCQKNQLLNVKVIKLSKLKKFNISDNSAVTALALGNNLALLELSADNTGLTDIDLSANAALKKLSLAGCSSMYIIDLTENTALTDLNVSGTSLATLDISNNTSLATLNCLNGIHIITNNTVHPIRSISAQWAYVDNVKAVFYSYGDRIKALSTDETSTAWGYYGTTTSATSADDGVSNTNKIASGSPAAQWCRNKGEAWYLPAKNELFCIYNNKTTLNLTLSSIGGTQLGTSDYWSSTEYSSSYAYNVGFELGNVRNFSKYNSYTVRAVRAL